MAKPLLKVEGLTMHYTTRKGDVSAVDDVSFTINEGESIGLVGESGCGKTSVALSLLRLLPDNAKYKSGHIWLGDTDILALPDAQMRKDVRWNRVSMVFQAAMNALNPVYTVADQIIEAMELHWDVTSDEEARERVAYLFDLVGLDPKFMDRYPHEFSGGMRQRAIIAMALVFNPDLIIADEPTTALDVIVQDRILKELRNIQDTLGMSMIYISHDVAVIAEVSDRIGVMYAGRMAELAEGVDIFERPLHPYTYALMQAFPSIKGEKHELITITGEPPDLLNPPPGCRFHPRCPNATAICRKEQPKFEDAGKGHVVACWNPMEVNA
ncbi:MAG: dipeptide/oligopeptide/nickel ABC transporter ATP-binding protein [Chloroflexi bacterium]|nr:MAG: dipeptide/oligopeptide/nickel ABC transporter ATP-binding protein [Chloroflexota bacterium]